jgi:hypothetical protein
MAPNCSLREIFGKISLRVALGKGTGAGADWIMILQSLQLTQLVDVVPLHGSGSYMGYSFCGNFTGVPEAAGQKVSCRVE